MTAQTVLSLTSFDQTRNLLVAGDFVGLAEFCGIPPERAYAAVQFRKNLTLELLEISRENPCVWEVLGKSIHIEEIESRLVGSLLNSF